LYRRRKKRKRNTETDDVEAVFEQAFRLLKKYKTPDRSDKMRKIALNHAEELSGLFQCLPPLPSVTLPVPSSVSSCGLPQPKLFSTTPPFLAEFMWNSSTGDGTQAAFSGDFWNGEMTSDPTPVLESLLNELSNGGY